ncbi:MAG: hypothetical protein WDW38_005534 [Sanguina aurantia]
MHSASAGVEHLMLPCILEAPTLQLTNAKGCYSESLAEYALFACNYFAKDLPRLMRSQSLRRWDAYDVEMLKGKTMGIIGYGDIGQACARLARAYKMQRMAGSLLSEQEPTSLESGATDGGPDLPSLRDGITGAIEQRTSHRKRPPPNRFHVSGCADGQDKIYPPSEMAALMAASDYVVMATPYTPATHQMVNAEALSAMRPTAVFINIGRGKCVDEEALVAALMARKLRGAALDVFEVEPLPSHSPLWEMDNVLVSAHTADRTKEFQFESMSFFMDNLDCYVRGKPLLSLVDIKAGY